MDHILCERDINILSMNITFTGYWTVLNSWMRAAHAEHTWKGVNRAVEFIVVLHQANVLALSNAQRFTYSGNS